MGVEGSCRAKALCSVHVLTYVCVSVGSHRETAHHFYTLGKGKIQESLQSLGKTSATMGATQTASADLFLPLGQQTVKQAL